MSNTPGGEVIFHPGPKHKGQGIKQEHGSHDVKIGYGGNDVIIGQGPKVTKGVPLGQHNTDVRAEPGNTVKMSRQVETELLSRKLPTPPPPLQSPQGVQAEDAESLLGDDAPTPSIRKASDESFEDGKEYGALLAQVSDHSRTELEQIASNMDIDASKTEKDDDLAALIATEILSKESD